MTLRATSSLALALLFTSAAFAQTPSSDRAPIRIGGDIRQPIKTKDVRPVYPPQALRAGISGIVILEINIDPAGKVRDARVLKSIPLLDQAALDAVRQWEYAPTLLNGQPVPILATATVSFDASGGRGAGPAVVPPIPQTAPAISEAVARAAALWQTHRSVQFVNSSTIDFTGEGIQARVTYDTSVSYVAPGKSRIETRAPIGLRFLTVSDGTNTWAYNGASKQYTKTVSAPDMTRLLADIEGRDLAGLLSSLGTNVTLAPVRDDVVTVDGRARPCSVIEGRLRDETLNVPAAMEARLTDFVMTTCLDRVIGVPLRTAVSLKTQIPSVGTPLQVSVTSVTSGLKVDETLADSLFVFTPPPGSSEAPLVMANPARGRLGAPAPGRAGGAGFGGAAGRGAGAGPYRVGGNIRQPQKLVDVRPVYPAVARASRIQGTVIIEAVIDENGNVQNAVVLKSIPELDAAALDAVRQWKYTPTFVDGQPVSIVMTVTVNFALN